MVELEVISSVKRYHEVLKQNCILVDKTYISLGFSNMQDPLYNVHEIMVGIVIVLYFSKFLIVNNIECRV